MNLNQATIPSLDLATSVTFYKRLGLRLIVDALPRYVRFELPEGEATLSVHLVDELPKGAGVVLYFETADVAGRVKALESQGVTFDMKTQEQTWLWTEARLRDPDGNQLIIFNAGENRKNPPWRIN